MSGTRGDDGRPQKRDQWGGAFQNEYGRILGSIESKLDFQSDALRELKNEGKGRDRALKDIEERVRGNAHKAANDFQILSNRVEGLDGKLVNVQVSVDTANKRMEQQGVELTGIGIRVGKLEAPMADALAVRDARRAKWRRWLMWLSAAGLFIWGGLEPVYKILVPVAVQRWLHLGGP
jgi:hypothetical protein